MAFCIDTAGIPLRWDQITANNVKVIINVSDNYDIIGHRKAQEFGILYHWFPMNEHNSEIGLNSLIAAIYILHLSLKQDHQVLVHCEYGKNRSVTVKEAFSWLRDDFSPLTSTPALDKNCDGLRLPNKDRLKEILVKFKNHLNYPGGFHSWLDFIKQ